jgi:chromosome segregation ATPase
MNREELRALGLTDEQIEKVLESHGKTIKAYKEKLVDYDEIKNAKEKLEKQVKDLNGTLTATNEKYADYDKNIEELNGKIKEYELKNLKYRIANESGIPLELASKLTGETEEDLKKDAETLSSFIRKPTLPLKHTEPNVDDKSAPYKEILSNLKLD